MKRFLKESIKLISSAFYVGYLPCFPGTWASLLAIGLYLLVQKDILLYLTLTLTILCLGFLTSGKAEEIWGRKDPPMVVIDEIGGMLIALFLLPPSIPLIGITFLLFRFLDISKISPVEIERWKGSKGIMADDIWAGVITNLIMQVVQRMCRW